MIYTLLSLFINCILKFNFLNEFINFFLHFFLLNLIINYFLNLFFLNQILHHLFVIFLLNLIFHYYLILFLFRLILQCYLKFFGKNLETSETIEKIKIQPKTELSLKVGNNEFKATNTGFDMQTTQFNVGAGANYVLTTTATIIAPTGGGACTITFAGQNIMKI